MLSRFRSLSLARCIAFFAVLAIALTIGIDALRESVVRGRVLAVQFLGTPVPVVMREATAQDFTPILRAARLTVVSPRTMEPAPAIGLASEIATIRHRGFVEVFATASADPAFVTVAWYRSAHPKRRIFDVPLAEPFLAIAGVAFLFGGLIAGAIVTGAPRASAAFVPPPPPPRSWPPHPDQALAKRIRDLERFAADRPRAYALSVLGACCLGYLMLLLALGVGIAWVGLWAYMISIEKVLNITGFLWALPGFVLCASLLRALWPPRPSLPANLLAPEEAPGLWNLAAMVTARLGTRRVDAIALTGDAQASISLVPRWRLVGPSDIVLSIGLPLLLALPREQIVALIAHEIGHVSRRQRRIAAWTYHSRTTWDRLWHRISDDQPWGSALMQRFLRWYVPWLDAQSFVLSRDFELDADRAAAAVAGKEVAAQTLANVVALDRYLEQRFWQPFVAQADASPEIPEPPFARMVAFWRSTPVDDATLKDAWQEALDREALPYSTHPTPKQRLAALDVPAAAPNYDCVPFAEEAFGDFLPEAVAHLDEAWVAMNAETWRERFEAIERDRQELASLDEAALATALETDRAFRRAQLTEALRGIADGRPLYQAIFAAHPDHVPSLYALGRAALGAGDEQGIGMLERCMALDTDAIIPACETIIGFLTDRERASEAEPFVRRYDERRYQLDAAQIERAELRDGDALGPHGLEPAMLEPVSRFLAELSTVRTAYLMRKQVAFLPDVASYVLAVRVRRGVAMPHTLDDVLQRIADSIPLPHTCVVSLDYAGRWRYRRLARESALIYRA